MTPQPPSEERQRAEGFSLLEIMVAVSLLAVIIVGLLAMFYQVQRAFRVGTAQVDVMEGGRATMNLITRDISEMTAAGFAGVNNCLILPSAPTQPYSSFSVQTLASGAARFNYLQDFCFLSRVNDEWVATAYRVDNPTFGAGTLYRWVQRTNAATIPFTNFLAVSNLSFQINDINLAKDVQGNFRPVLDGVVGLTVTAFDKQGVSFHDSIIYPDANNQNERTHFESANDVHAFRSDFVPAYVEVELAVLEPGAFEKFNARLDLNSPFPLSIERATNYLARQIGRTHIFRQRIPIRATDGALTSF